jgi:TatD DNase family protein
MRLYDTHVNFHARQFIEGRVTPEDLVTRGRNSGVAGFLAISDTFPNAGVVANIAAQFSDVFASVGAHPHNAKDHLHLTPADLVDFAGSNPNVIAIGETGLDLHYNYSAFEEQLDVLRCHIDAARITGLPLIVHSRSADLQMAQMLEEEMGKGAFRFLLHCYTSGPELARRGLEIGGYVSFSGIVTFKNAHDVRGIAKSVPDDRLILETDCPYLAPVPMRGRVNEPSLLPHVYDFMASLKGVETSTLADMVEGNVGALFPRMVRA